MARLTLTDRIKIESSLNQGESFAQIAKQIKVARTTVMREVKRYYYSDGKGAQGRLTNRCLLKDSCERLFLCEVCIHALGKRKCSSCRRCNTVCPDFQEITCEKLALPPYVCNGCKAKERCILRKKFYGAKIAEDKYKMLLVEARKGAAITENERIDMGSILATGLKQGQSVHHILTAHKDSFTVCEKTVYNYINAGILIVAKRHHLPVAPKLKQRRKKNPRRKINPQCRLGRKIEDYKAFCCENPDLPLIEMDSFEGKKGGKVLLTINFDQSALMLAFIRERNDSKSVIDIFNMLEEILTLTVFKKLFPVILTDNGSEFTNPDMLEKSHITGERRCNIFYCNPYSSWQKPNVENNHLNLRKIFPKGESFDHVTQDKLAVALSHLNSMHRVSLNDIPAIKLFEKVNGKGILEKLGINLIEPKSVRLCPEITK